MDYIRLGLLGIAIASVGIAAEWWAFLVGKPTPVLLATCAVGFVGILITLTAARGESNRKKRYGY